MPEMNVTPLPKNIYQAAARDLGNAADALNQTTKGLLTDAKGQVGKAKLHAGEAVDSALGAVANSVIAGAYAIDGTLRVGEAGGRAAAGVAIGTVATAGWSLEGLGNAARLAFKNLAKFFSGVANVLAKHLGNPERVSLEVSILGDPAAKRFSERMFEKAGDQFKLSGEALGFAWDSYVTAVENAAGSVANAGIAAFHVGATAAHLAEAGIVAGAAGPVKLAELSLRAAKVAVQYAEKGVEAARDASILAAELCAAAANGLAHPSQDQYKISATDISKFEARLQKLEAAA